MAIEVFNRYENKYLLDTRTFARLESRLAEYMELDAFNQGGKTYSITNLYYDTKDSQLIRTSLSKPRYKEKLRLRAYGVPQAGAEVFVEIKKKFNGLTNKRRSAIALEDAYSFLSTGELPQPEPYVNAQVLREIQYMLSLHQLRPALYLAYDRRAYFGIGEHDLRISFDCNIRTRRTELRLEAGDEGEPLLGPDTWLMEVKSAKSIPLWLARLLSEFSVYPTSFSKYGAEYKGQLAAKNVPPILEHKPVSERRTAAALATA